MSQASRAASLDAQSREALLQSTRLMVQADVAQTYLALRFADQERRLVRDTVAAYRETLALTQRRYQAGDVAELDLARVQTEVAATEAEAISLDRRRAELEHRKLVSRLEQRATRLAERAEELEREASAAREEADTAAAELQAARDHPPEA